jgi:hypothetical protein
MLLALLMEVAEQRMLDLTSHRPKKDMAHGVQNNPHGHTCDTRTKLVKYELMNLKKILLFFVVIIEHIVQITKSN